MRKISYLLVAVLALSIALPSMALAHDDENRSNLSLRQELRSKLDLNRDGDQDGERIKVGLGWGVLFKRGVVTSVGSGEFVMKSGSGETITVDVSDAKLVRLFHTEISLSDFHVNDKVWVHGNVDGNEIDALVVYNLQENSRPAMIKGEVTAVNDGTLTVETKNKGTVTVNTDSNTVVTQDGEISTASEAEVGAKIKGFGILDTIAHIFTAIRLKIM